MLLDGIKFWPYFIYCSSGQLVIVDIMLGHYTRVERPMEKGDDIIDIAMTDKHVILYNNKYYRYKVSVE